MRAALLVQVACVALVLAAPRAAGQSAPRPVEAGAPAVAAASANPVVKVFEIRHADLGEVSLVLPTLLSDSNVLTIDRASRTVTVVDEPEFVQRVSDWLRQFDVLPHAVLVRIVLEKAERRASAPSDASPGSSGWTYVPLAETTLEVKERGTATQSIGDDGAFEVRVRLGAVDAERGTMRFDEVAVRRREPPQPGVPAAMRDVFSTSLDAKDRVGKVVMATRDPAADAALVLRLLALIREQEPGG